MWKIITFVVCSELLAFFYLFFIPTKALFTFTSKSSPAEKPVLGVLIPDVSPCILHFSWVVCCPLELNYYILCRISAHLLCDTCYFNSVQDIPFYSQNCLLFYFCYLFRQGHFSHSHPKAISPKILVSLSWFVCHPLDLTYSLVLRYQQTSCAIQLCPRHGHNHIFVFSELSVFLFLLLFRQGHFSHSRQITVPLKRLLKVSAESLRFLEITPSFLCFWVFVPFLRLTAESCAKISVRFLCDTCCFTSVQEICSRVGIIFSGCKNGQVKNAANSAA